MCVLIQYVVNDGEIKLFHPWKRRICETLTLIEWMMTHTVVGFNLAFDHFHLCKLYTTFKMFPDHDAIPEEHIEELAILEEKARFSDICLKPKGALDLMLFSRKGPYQCLMARKDIRIKKVPAIMADRLRSELANRVQLDGIYFNDRKDPHAPQWNVYESKDKDGVVHTEFQDIVLKFKPDASLKSLAQHLLGVKEDLIFKFADVEVDKKLRPWEGGKNGGYAPFALAWGRPGKWKGAWPDVIKFHIDHWYYNKIAQKYARNDVVYTRDLHHHPKFADAVADDDDSVLACMVGAVRWRGFPVDLEKVAEQRSDALLRAAKAPKDSRAVKRWLRQVMSDEEFLTLEMDGTGDTVLQEITGTKDETKCECKGKGECDRCEDGLIIQWLDGWEDENGDPHPAALRARDVRDARSAGKEVELYDKLLHAKRFHASFKVIGTLSTRMAGTDGLNPQGIINSKYVRSCFTLQNEETEFEPKTQLDGGDFESFEVCISAAVYKDKGLENDLKSGKKIHALLAEALFPDQSYDSIMASKGSKAGRDYYTDGKRGVFGLNYGGDASTLVNRLGVSEDVAENTFRRFYKRYPGVAKAREQIIEWFCSMRQPGGIGTRVEWHEPREYIESLLGFRRYFTLENQICKALFQLAENPPKEWQQIRIKVVRRDREQTASGAVRSALFGAAFGLQGNNMRAAANHVIQSTGAGITKAVERVIWDLQPAGINNWKVGPINIHDEIMVRTDPKISGDITRVVDAKVKTYRPIVPLISIDWGAKLKSWAEK
jgi:hypothetical protein